MHKKNVLLDLDGISLIKHVEVIPQPGLNFVKLILQKILRSKFDFFANTCRIPIKHMVHCTTFWAGDLHLLFKQKYHALSKFVSTHLAVGPSRLIPRS